MRCLVGLDDTDSSRGQCTTHLAYRIAIDLSPYLEVLPYPRLVRLNPNIPFKTRGNAAVCLRIETSDPESAFERISAKLSDLSDVSGGANSGMVFLQDESLAPKFRPLYKRALSGLVNPHAVRRLLKELRFRHAELGNGMGLVGAAASLGFDEASDHTYELISYRTMENWGTTRPVDSSSVKQMDARTFPHTFNNYDYQKRRVLVAPHGPDPVFAGVRGDSPASVLEGFNMLRYDEPLDGHMVYVTNQHTDAHLQEELIWKVYSSGWLDGSVQQVEVGPGRHVYITLLAGRRSRLAAAYEPTGDLRRAARLLRRGDKIRAFGGVRKATSLHPAALNLEKFDVISLNGGERALLPGTYISSPRANRHLTKPLIRYGRETTHGAGEVEGWLSPPLIRQRAHARSR
jgi:tRNA(Ile2)-agmatinylcytidine synthase